MGLLREWWDKLLGREDEPPHAAAMPLMRPVRPEQPAPLPSRELEIQEDGAGQGSRPGGSAGFDPYGNDAGFAKPHSWERIDHD